MDDQDLTINVQIKTVKTESFSMDYFQFGHGEETFVILPGLSVQSVMKFADIVAEEYQLFTDNYTIYVFDRRKELPDSYSVHEMVQDTAEALGALGLNQVNLFGASQGGMIAMEMAIEQPQLIQKLILGSTSACVEEVQYQIVNKWIHLAKSEKKEELYLSLGEAIYPKDVFEQLRNMLVETAETVTDKDLDRFIILAESMKGFDITNDLGQINCPVFVLGSLDDHVLGAKAALHIVEHLNNQKGLVLEIYDGYGHAAYDTAPDYKEQILRFLTQETA